MTIEPILMLPSNDSCFEQAVNRWQTVPGIQSKLCTILVDQTAQDQA
jgi:hypothetical protein